MSGGSPGMESLLSSHLPVKLPSRQHFPRPHWAIALSYYEYGAAFRQMHGGQFLWEDHCVWTMNSLQDTIKALERKHFFVHILQKSREPASEALHSNCVQITPPGSSVNDRKTQRSRNCLQMASKITFIFIWHSLVKSKTQQLILYLICSFLDAYLVDYMEVVAWIINMFAAITGEKFKAVFL